MVEGGGEKQVTGASSGAPDVFISFASPDSAVATAVCAALEHEGVTCWLAPRDVMPGEFYGDAIVHAIDAAKALVVVLSENSIGSPHVLREVERASSKRHPVISLRIDRAPLPSGLEYFLNTSQWLDASGEEFGGALPKLATAVRRVIASPHDARPLAADRDPPPRVSTATSVPPPRPRDTEQQSAAPTRRSSYVIAASLVAAVVLAAAVVLGLRFFATGHGSQESVATRTQAAPLVPTPVSAASFSPPAHSVAVLPFVNMTGDPKQDYFSDGLSEELLNSLTSVRDLQVAARTSSFFFKGKEVDLSDIAHKLNVGAVLEGSVRKDANQVRITAQIINAVTGFHLWSQTYDRDLKDVLKLQTEIASAVTTALQATLLADAAAKIEVGGTRNPQAFDAYLRGKNAGRDKSDRTIALARIAAFDEAIRLDPSFAKAYASKAASEVGFAEYYALQTENRDHFNRARAAAERAIELAPDLGEAHSALAVVLAGGFLDFSAALVEHERALELSPNDSGVLLSAGWFFVDIGRTDAGVAMARKGVSVDQLNSRAYRTLSIVLQDAHHYRESLEAAQRALTLNPNDMRQAAVRGQGEFLLGDVERARESCSTPPLDWEGHLCLALVYDKLHRRSDAEAQVASMKTDLGDSAAYQYAEIYAQWGDIPAALGWIEKAYELKDPGILSLRIDPFFDPLRKEARFQEIERKLKYPS
jgi:TolB-like protein